MITYINYLKYFCKIPYEIPLTANILYSIILAVRVPVLSENIYSTYPNSSFKLEDWTAVGTFVPSFSVKQILWSFWINIP